MQPKKRPVSWEKTHQNVVELLPLDLAELVGVERPHKLARLDQGIPSEQLDQVGRALVAPVRERRRDRDAARRAKVEHFVLLDADGRETGQARDHHVDGNVFAVLAHVDVSVDLRREDTRVGVEAGLNARDGSVCNPVGLHLPMSTHKLAFIIMALVRMTVSIGRVYWGQQKVVDGGSWGNHALLYLWYTPAIS